MTGAAIETGTLRLCATEDCDTRLSRFNPSMKCAACEARLEIGGARIPLPKQPAFPPRAPAPKRPTTEGGITLARPITVTPERPLAEMLAKPAGKTPTPAPKCAECGEPLPKGHEGWLCRLCTVAADPPRADTPTDTTSLGTPPTRIPPPAHEDSKAHSKAAKNGSHVRRFDWDDAARRYQTGLSYARIGEQLGVSAIAVRHAVTRTLTPEQIVAAVAAKPPANRPKTGGRTRSFDRDEAVRLYRETRNIAEVARRFGVTDSPVRNAVKAILGDAYPLTDPTPVAPIAEEPTEPPPALDPERRLELARLAAELDEIHNEQTRLYARWRVTAERHAELLRDAS